MKKGHYFFGECGALSKTLITAGLASFAVSAVFFFMGGWEVLVRTYAVGNMTYSIWCAFFLLFGIIFILINICVHKICRDIATLLNKIEDNKTKKI